MLGEQRLQDGVKLVAVGQPITVGGEARVAVERIERRARQMKRRHRSSVPTARLK